MMKTSLILLLSFGTCLGSFRTNHNNIRGKKDAITNNESQRRATREEVICESDDAATNALVHTGKRDIESIAERDATNDRYLAWAAAASNENTYKNSIFIPTAYDKCKGIGFHWSIEPTTKTIRIAAAAKMDFNSDSGWLAIGHSETGGMRGADIVYFTTSSPKSLVDAHILDYLGFPVSDGDDGQDWTLVNYLMTDDGYLIFEAARALDTNDEGFDRAFVDDSSAFVSNHKIIAAWGSGDYMAYHGQNRVHSSVQLFASSDSEDDGVVDQPYDKLMKVVSSRAEGSSDLVMNNYPIPSVGNFYYNLCFTYAELKELGFFDKDDDGIASYVIGYEFMIQPETRKYIHHLQVDASRSVDCSTDHATVFGWAPGEETFYYPKGSGMKFGGSDPDEFKSLIVQYHINNPSRDVGKVDNGTGIRLFHTTKPVKYEIGLFELDIGDPHISFTKKPIGAGLTRHTFSCPSECSQESFTSDIVILKQAFHMHGTGKRIVNEVLRNGKVIHETHVDYFDFFQTAAPAPQVEPFRVKQGDSFRTSCYFDATDTTVFGGKSQDEMCQVYMLYFPKQPVDYCGSPSPRQKQCYAKFDGKDSLHDLNEIGRVFGYSDESELS